MGDPVPPGPVEFLDDKWYYIKVDCFQDGSSKWDCTQTYVDRVGNALIGLTINTWLMWPHECVAGAELTPFTGFSAQRLVYTDGPYDTRQEAIDAN